MNAKCWSRSVRLRAEKVPPSPGATSGNVFSPILHAEGAPRDVLIPRGVVLRREEVPEKLCLLQG